MKTVSREQVATAERAGELALPPRVQEALGQLVGSAKEGLLALSVGVGLGVLAELLEEEVVDVVGAKGKHDPDRVAVRHGHESGEVTLGGRRVAVERPRVRSADRQAEVRLRTYEYFADRDPLTKAVLERMLAGVSTRRYRRTQEPVGTDVEQAARSTSKSSVSRTFIERTRGALSELMSRRLDDVRLAVMMLDGLELQGRTNVVALGITTEGVKIPLGLWEGSTENATVATALLSDLVERGLDPEQGILFVIDGAKALRKAIRNVFGEAPVQRCVRHKECHEEGPPAGADFCAGDNPEGGPWCSSMLDSIGDTDAHAGARKRATGRCSRRIGCRRMRTGSSAWLPALARR
jgi:putative transposase